MSSNDPSPTPPVRRITAIDLIAATLVGFLFLVANIRFGGSVAADELDPSWTMVLTWASKHGLRWGSDIAFTYGPLGYLYPLAAADPDRYAFFIVAQIALGAAAAFLFAHAWVVQRWPERFVLLAAVVFASPLLFADPVWLAAPVFALVGVHAHAVAGRRRTLWVLIAVAASFSAVLLLIKMSALLLIVGAWLATAVVLWRARLPRHAVAWLLLVPAICLALWIASGQHLGDLLPFISDVLEISRGYTAAMGAPPPLRFDLYGLAVFGGCGLVAAWTAWRSRHDLARLAGIALCGLALFVAWRAGFTRADTHIYIFALTTWLVLPLLPAFAPAAALPMRVLAIGLVLAVTPLADRVYNAGPNHKPGEMAIASLGVITNNAQMLLQPLAYRRMIDTALAEGRERLDLPQTRAVVGTRSVDLAGTTQGVVLVNGFAYRPSPVFQGYGAYTERLQRLNAGAYSGPDRTDFVLLAYSPIDGNLPSSENATAFTALYRNYHPVLVEKGYLLLERDGANDPPPPPEAGWQTTTWDTWIDLPATPEAVTVLAVRSELSLPGKLAATLLREPLQHIELQLDDGTTQRFRLGRGVAPGGFLVSPLVQSLDDYVRLFIGDELPAVRRFRLVPQGGALRALFANTLQWRATPLPRRARREPSPSLLAGLYPGFSHLPQARTGSIRTIDVDGRRALLMHSPSQLTFRPGAGRWVVSGEIGIAAGAFAEPTCQRGDGVQLDVSGDAGATLSFPYNPFADAALRPSRRFELGPVSAGAGGLLRLDITPGPANNGDCDWAWVRDVTLRAP